MDAVEAESSPMQTDDSGSSNSVANVVESAESVVADVPAESYEMQDPEEAAAAQPVQPKMELAAADSKKYMLPTYGIPYPEASLSSKDSSPGSKLFRPVQFYSTGESEEEEEEDPVNNRSGSHVSVDSAYSSQSDAAKIEVKLHKKNLWKGFMNIGNEMIVTKPGR